MQTPKHQAPWRDLTPSPSFEPLRGKLQVDTAIVGAGITGATVAWQLARAGQKVALIDMGNVGAGETGKTTSHLTAIMDGGTAALRKKHGEALAAKVLAAQHEAIASMEAWCTEFGPSTRFRRVPAYLFSEDKQGVSQVDAEHEALKAMGVPSERLPKAPLPFSSQAALRVDGQAQFEPMAYLAAMAKRIVEAQGRIFTGSQVLHVEDGAPCKLSTAEGEISAQHLILATHTPPNRLAYHTQIFAYRTYVLAATCSTLPPPGLYFDTADPYHYIRTQDTPSGDILIVGGNDHKTGKQDDKAAYFANLEGYARERFAIKNVDYVWSGQIMEPADMLPFVGPNGGDTNTLFASGYSGNGITLGTVAAQILADAVLGRDNAYASLFSSRRLDLTAQLGAMARENIDVPVHMVGDRVTALGRSEEGIPRGEGRVVNRGAHMVALYCDDGGKQHALSAVCPHMGCLVNWNTAEKSWDCPCHGSRFSSHGKLLNGPALENLKPAT